MIEMQRTPARILKNRDVQSGGAPREAIAPLESVAATAANPQSIPSAPAAGPQPARCIAKEARLVPGEGGATSIEVRCSCGEWTRVELQLGAGESR